MNKLVCLMLPLMLTACISSMEGYTPGEDAKNKGFLVLDYDVVFDGEQKNRNCRVGAAEADKDGKHVGMEDLEEQIGRDFDNQHIKIFKFSNPGIKKISAIGCSDVKLLWSKMRYIKFKPPLEVDVKPGVLTYPGTMVVDWESEGFGLVDLTIFSGIGGDDGKIAVKRENRAEKVKAYIRQKSPELLEQLDLVTTKFEPSSSIVQ